ncbi:MAG: DUF6675 family protein [Spirochaetota bacterium]
MKHGLPTSIVAALLITMVSPVRSAAAPVSSFLPAAALAAPDKAMPLPETGLRATSTGKSAAPTIMPVHPASAALRAALADEGPDVVVEALFSWKKPTRGAPEAELLTLYNIFRSIGSLEGIEYWSASRNTMRLFYEISHLTSGPDTTERIQDSRLEAIPVHRETLYARQKDLSFGDNRYQITLQAGSDYVTNASSNLTGMRYGIIPVAAPGMLNVRVLAINADDAVLFYAVSSAKAAVLPGVRGKLENSFGNRAAAIYTWFARQAVAAWPALPQSGLP